jgi:hypothetical protein
MMRLGSGVLAAFAIGAFLIVANISYLYLVANFGYDDVLRQPAALILESFAAGGAELIAAWTAFAWSALIFVLAACLIGKALAQRHGQIVWMATIAGAASGIVQAAGLLRWVFVVPSLATAYPSAHPVQQLVLAENFTAVNQYGGVALGEHLGQMLMVAWTIGVVAACWRAGGLLRWSSFIGMLTVPLWLIGQSELFATVIPALPSIEATPFAFMLWMLWLLALGGAIAFQAKTIKPRARAAPIADNGQRVEAAQAAQ